MPNYLIIRGNKVENVIVADTQEIAEAVSPNATEVIESIGSEPWINWTRVDGVWSAPVVTEEISAEPTE
jgi:hypothetical protein